MVDKVVAEKKWSHQVTHFDSQSLANNKRTSRKQAIFVNQETREQYTTQGQKLTINF